MGMCLSAEDKELNAKNSAIEKLIQEDAKKLEKECKILLLGAGESGKSTVVKQMKIIHQNGYTREETLSYIVTIHKNLIDSIQNLILAGRKMELKFQDDVEEIARKITTIRADLDLSFKISPQLAADIDKVYKDPTTKSILDRSHEFYIIDSAP
ncbi:Guanine nucleotide-binding protein alpha-2 subunit [Nowakowskiella sp. JEL0407]|nr:Guanine nucleotide-binding protein alpha-2 subunit [Nowakowskiella sp. JEL0407]